MVIRTLYQVSPMNDDNYTQTEKNIHGMKVIIQFPYTSAIDRAIEEIRLILLDIFTQNFEKERLQRNDLYE